LLLVVAVVFAELVLLLEESIGGDVCEGDCCWWLQWCSSS
jgi:hypothetical protein